MLKHSKVVIISAAGLLLAAMPAFAKKPLKAPVQTAIIENTGSTNTTGYQLQVSSDGRVMRTYTTGDMPAGSKPFTGKISEKAKPIDSQDASKFFNDLNAAMPLTSLPVRHGMRSASFGTATFITYKGQRSPDLTFASDSRTAALKADIEAITKTLGVGNAPRRPIVVNQSNKPIGSENFKERF